VTLLPPTLTLLPPTLTLLPPTLTLLPPAPTRAPTVAPTPPTAAPTPPTEAPTNAPTKPGDYPVSTCISEWIPYSTGVSTLCSSCRGGTLLMIRNFLNVPECQYVLDSDYSFYKAVPCTFPCPTDYQNGRPTPNNVSSIFYYIVGGNLTYFESLLREAQIPAEYSITMYV
jgi:hypothetical protein